MCYGEVKNYPCQFIASEKLDNDLYNLKFRNKESKEDEWLSYLFQITAALIVSSSAFIPAL